MPDKPDTSPQPAFKLPTGSKCASSRQVCDHKEDHLTPLPGSKLSSASSATTCIPRIVGTTISSCLPHLSGSSRRGTAEEEPDGAVCCAWWTIAHYQAITNATHDQATTTSRCHGVVCQRCTLGSDRAGDFGILHAWWVSPVSRIQQAADCLTAMAGQLDADHIPPPLATIPFVLLSISWAFWDPTWLTVRRATLQGKRIRVSGRPEYIVSRAFSR